MASPKLARIRSGGQAVEHQNSFANGSTVTARPVDPSVLPKLPAELRLAVVLTARAAWPPRPAVADALAR